MSVEKKRDGETSRSEGLPICKKDCVCVEGWHNQIEGWTEEQHRFKGCKIERLWIES